MNVMEFALNVMDLERHHTHLHLGLHVNIVVQFGLKAIFGRLAILADKHKNGKEDSFQRYGHGQELVGIRIEVEDPGSSSVGNNPDGEDDEIDQQEYDGAAELGDDIGNALAQRDML